MTNKFAPYFFALSGFFVLPSFAAAKSYITCEDRTTFLKKCVVSQETLVAKSNIQQSFIVKYAFPCIGHGVQVGITEGSSSVFRAFKQTTNEEELTIEGLGPLTIADSNKSWTESARFQPGCKLSVLNISQDLSVSEKKRLDDLTSIIVSQEKVVSDALSVASNASVLKNILVQLDVNSIASILADKYNNVSAMAEKFRSNGNTGAATELDSVKDDLKLAICLNTSLAEQYPVICPEVVEAIEPGSDPKPTIVARANTALTNLETSASDLKDTASSAASGVVVSITDLIAYASPPTRQEAIDTVCPAFKKLSINTTFCPIAN